MRPARHHANFAAFAVHRVSGLLLALFLPLHLWVLGLALEGEAALDEFLRWSDHPWVKMSEVGLILLLAAHLTGGVRLLMVEFLPWRDSQKTILSLSAGFALAFALAFLMNLL